jgi:hypothetical protein
MAISSLRLAFSCMICFIGRVHLVMHNLMGLMQS